MRNGMKLKKMVLIIISSLIFSYSLCGQEIVDKSYADNGGILSKDGKYVFYIPNGGNSQFLQENEKLISSMIKLDFDELLNKESQYVLELICDDKQEDKIFHWLFSTYHMLFLGPATDGYEYFDTGNKNDNAVIGFLYENTTIGDRRAQGLVKIRCLFWIVESTSNDFDY